VPINFTVDKNQIAKKSKNVVESNSCCQQLSILLQVLVTRPVVTAQSCCFGREQQAFLLLLPLKPATCQALTSEELLIQVLPEDGGSSLLVKSFLLHDPQCNKCRSENKFT
jgi:hypothetical protein